MSVRGFLLYPSASALLALRQMRIPGAPGFRLHLSEPGARWRIRDADEMLAAGALNLPPGMARVALQRLVTVGTIEFEFGCVHRLHLSHAQNRPEKYIENFSILFLCRLRM